MYNTDLPDGIDIKFNDIQEDVLKLRIENKALREIIEELRNELAENQSDCAICDIIKSNNELKEQLEKIQDCDLCNRKFDGKDCDIRNCKHFDPAACKILLKELKDADEKLVYVSCQYSKCFEIMTELVEIITELDCDFEIVHKAEQFIKENK